jgi:adenylylsulfate kinase
MKSVHQGCVVWFTGRPAAGKSTLAWKVRKHLLTLDRPSVVLDGDQVRASLVPTPSYTRRGRDGFYTTLALLAAMLARQDAVVLVPATANRRAYRRRARDLSPRFLEVYVHATPEECRARDVKGLYAASAAGGAATLPGVGDVYEVPIGPDIVAHGGHDEEAVHEVVAALARGRWSGLSEAQAAHGAHGALG